MLYIPKYTDKGYPDPFVKALLNGTLEGITRSFRMAKPKLVDSNQQYFVYELGMEKPLGIMPRIFFCYCKTIF